MPLHISPQRRSLCQISSMLTDRYCAGKKSCLSFHGVKPVMVRVQPTLFNSARRPSLCPLTQSKPIDDIESPKTKPDPKKDDMAEVPIDEAEAPLLLGAGTRHVRTRPDLELPNLVALDTTYNTPGFHNLFMQKVALCYSICDFDSDAMDVQAKRVKENTLKELLACYELKPVFAAMTKEHHGAILDMCEKNIFRSLPAVPTSLLVYENIPPMQDKHMQHLSLVYSLMKKLIGPKVDVAIRPRLGIDLCKNLECPDVSEREMVSDLLLAYYQIRPNERKQLLECIAGHIHMYRADCSHVPPFCVWPVLKILVNVYKAASPHLPDELITYFVMYVVPLLSSRHLKSFMPVFKALCDIVVMNDSAMARYVMKYCLDQFPTMAANKQVCIFELMNDLMVHLTPQDFNCLCPLMFSRYAQGVESGNAKVAEMSMRIWSDSRVLPQIFDHSKQIFPIFFHAIVLCSREHWNQKVKARAMAVLKVMRDVNLNLFDDMASCRCPCARNKQKMWAGIARAACKNDGSVDLGRTLSNIQVLFNQTVPLGSPLGVQASPPVVQSPPQTAVIRRRTIISPVVQKW